MEIYQRLANLLSRYQASNQSLQGWRFDLHLTDGLDIGLKNNKIGGPYSAPGYKQSVSGEIYLIWENHRFTSAKLEARVVEDFNNYMNLWEKTSYIDPDGVGLYNPPALPEVNLADQHVQQMINHNSEEPFRLLAVGLDALLNRGIRKVDARVRCFQDYRFLMNSDGLKIVYEQTPTEFYFVANDSYGKGYSEKKWPEDAEINHVIDTTVSVGKMLDQPVQVQFSGAMTLIFPPEIFESFLSHFLLTNLYGSLVVNRQSRFSLEDFRNGRQVLRDDLSLSINNLLPYRGSSYICTSEGVPGAEKVFIDSGKLQTPILNLKYAKKAGMDPTPTTSGGGGFFLISRGSMPSWERLLSQTEKALIVYSILGMHTQDASSGNFSVTADQCLWVEDGEIKGKVKAVINGDFLEALNRPDSQFCTVEGEDNPGFAFTASAYSA